VCVWWKRQQQHTQIRGLSSLAAFAALRLLTSALTLTLQSPFAIRCCSLSCSLSSRSDEEENEDEEEDDEEEAVATAAAAALRQLR